MEWFRLWDEVANLGRLETGQPQVQICRVLNDAQLSESFRYRIH